MTSWTSTSASMSAATPVSSSTSRCAAARAVSPGSRCPPGKLHSPLSAPLARTMRSTASPRKTAALAPHRGQATSRRRGGESALIGARLAERAGARRYRGQKRAKMSPAGRGARARRRCGGRGTRRGCPALCENCRVSICEDPPLVSGEGHQFADFSRHGGGKRLGSRGARLAIPEATWARPGYDRDTAGRGIAQKSMTQSVTPSVTLGEHDQEYEFGGMDMAYKGTDLDLRTPRLASPSEPPAGPLREPASNGGGVRPAGGFGAPLAVDETVVAGCNRAYDMARFHAAPDVRLEHLLHALTRVGVAAEALAEVGIRVDSLRRDTAVAIAADLPARPLEADTSPRSSVAFEHVLRRAADQAGRRQAPAGVHDLIRTMLGGGPGSPAGGLLMQAAADPQRLERWRDAPLRAAFDPAATVASVGAASAPVSPELAEALIGRLDAMASSLQGFEAQAAADRQALSALLRKAQSALQALGGEGAPTAGARAQVVEAQAVEALLGRLGESAQRAG